MWKTCKEYNNNGKKNNYTGILSNKENCPRDYRDMLKKEKPEDKLIFIS